MRRDRAVQLDHAAGSAERAALLLGAGLGPAEALTAAGIPSPEASPPPATRDSAAYASLHAAVAVARIAGAALGPVLLAHARELRQAAEAHRELQVAAAGPRLTARVLTALPAAAVVLASLLGFDVLGVLVGSPLGLALLAFGTALAIGGALWSHRLVAAADAAPVGADGGLPLIALALRAGLPTASAIRVAQEVADGPPLAAELTPLIALSRRTGIPLAGLLENEAEAAARRRQATARRRIEELGGRLLAPLGLCVLPSFLLLGVAPAVIAITSSTVRSM